MQYVCLGYLEESHLEAMSERDRSDAMRNCRAYKDVLKEGGHFAGSVGLQPVRNAATMRYADGKVTVTDGPFAETKEQLGGIFVLEARDLNHAIQLMSEHPGLRQIGGCFEIRPAMEVVLPGRA